MEHLGIDLTIFGVAEEATVTQMRNCMDAEEGAKGVLCADNHLGYSQPIGGAVAYRDHISPSGVGYDIGCGNKAVRTDLSLYDLYDASIDELDRQTAPGPIGTSLIPRIMDEIVRRISFGMGRKNNAPVDHPVLDRIREASFTPQRQLYDLAAKQLGTVGAGNHYVDLFADEEDSVWIGVHFGSRGFGHKTASGFLALAQGKKFGQHASEGGMMSPPVIFGIDSDLGQSYIEAMILAGAYAYAGRDVVVDTVLDILGTTVEEEVHNHHNFAWREEHGGEEFWVVRKGCTPAWPGQRGFVGSTMGEESVILRGVENSNDALASTVHGAGRVMSRTKAAGKTKRRKRWECNDRNCDYFHTDLGQFACPDHPSARPLKRVVKERVSPGLIDFPVVQATLRERNIELRGGAADEAPGAYKRLDEVLAAHAGTIAIEHRLRPLGVAMAGGDEFDPFKD